MTCTRLAGLPCLSIRPPWWGFILATGPDRQRFENRVWPRARWPRWTGPLLIHASTWWNTEAVHWMVQDMHAAFAGKQRLGRMPGFDTLGKMRALGGHLVGCVDLVGCAPGREHWGNPWVSVGGASPDNHVVLILDNPRPIEPIPYRGRLGFFRYRPAS